MTRIEPFGQDMGYALSAEKISSNHREEERLPGYGREHGWVVQNICSQGRYAVLPSKESLNWLSYTTIL